MTDSSQDLAECDAQRSHACLSAAVILVADGPVPGPGARHQEALINAPLLASEVGVCLPLETRDTPSCSHRRFLGLFARALLRERRMRLAEFPAGFFGEPVWDILLDMYAAEQEGMRLCVSSVCIASGAPPTTALRYIRAIETAGLISREPNPADRRGSFLSLSESARLSMESLLDRMARTRELPIFENRASVRCHGPA